MGIGNMPLSTWDEVADVDRTVAVTYTWVFNVPAGEAVTDCAEMYCNSVSWAFDEPVMVEVLEEE